MSYTQEFATVSLILDSNLETRGVDAFILSLIKAEKQIRRVFTFLVFQNPSYTLSNFVDLRNTLADNNRVYFEGFIRGIDLILSRTLKDIYGTNYDSDIATLVDFTKDRNKIFHGQITANGLKRENLLEKITHIKTWCETLANKLNPEIGYDGFSNSFIKSSSKLTLNNFEKFNTIENYKKFIKDNLQR